MLSNLGKGGWDTLSIPSTINGDVMAGNSNKPRVGIIADLFGGLTGKAVSNIKNRRSRIDSAVNQALGKPANKKRKRKGNSSVLNKVTGGN